MKRVPSEGTLENVLTFNQKILRATLVVAILSGFAMLGSVGRELVVAQWFGRSDALDAFLIAYLLPTFLVNVVAGSFGPAFVPTFIQVRDQEGREGAQRLFSSVMVASLILMGVVVVLLGVLAPAYLPLLGSGFSAPKLLMTRRLLYVLLPFVAFSGLASIWTSVLNAGERFALPALLPVLPPVSAIVFLLALGKVWGIFALALGTILGAGTQAVLLGWELRAQGVRLSLRWYGMDARLRQVAGQYGPALAGALLMGSTDLVDQSMAAMLPPGSVAALNYGKKIISLMVVVGAKPLGTAVLPYFSQMVADHNWDACRHTLKTYARYILLISVPLTALIVVISHPLVRLLFQRGAFGASDTAVVGQVQAFLALEIPFYLLGIMGVRALSALKRNSMIMFIAGVNVAVNVVFNWILMKYAGVAGIALSTSLVYFISCSLIYGSLALLLGGKLPREEKHGVGGL
jgi:putative peptidoglycan lipid II flippase